MSNYQVYCGLLAKRSTAQGVVRRHLNRISRLLDEVESPDVDACKASIVKVLSAKDIYDKIHYEALELGFLMESDTQKPVETASTLDREVTRTCDEAQSWIESVGAAALGDYAESSSGGIRDERDTGNRAEGESTVGWESRYRELERSHQLETGQLRNTIDSLRSELDELRKLITSRTERGSSTPEKDNTRRVTFEGLQVSAVDRGGVQSRGGCEHDEAPLDLTTRGHCGSSRSAWGPEATAYAGHGRASAGFGGSGRAVLDSIPEDRRSPPGRASRGLPLMNSQPRERYYGDRVPVHYEGRSQNVAYEKEVDITATSADVSSFHTRLLEQSQIQHRSLMASLRVPNTEIKKFSGDPLEFSAFFNAFDELVDITLDSYRAKLSSLMAHCEGEAYRAIRACAHQEAESGYRAARLKLANKFGTPYKVSQAWLGKLLAYGNLRSPEELENFASDLVCARESLSSLGKLGELECTNSLRLIVVKLPIHLRNRWRKIHREEVIQKGKSALDELVRLIGGAAEDVSDPAFGEAAMEKARNTYGGAVQQRMNKPSNTQTQFGYGRRAAVHLTEADEDLITWDEQGDSGEANKDGAYSFATRGSRATCTVCSSSQHFASKCKKYKEKGPADRLRLVKEKRLCHLCLGEGHAAVDCALPWKCQEKGCSFRHHTSLHQAFAEHHGQQVQESVNLAEKDSREAQVHSLQVTGDLIGPHMENCCFFTSTMPCLPVAAVTVRSGNRRFDTYALLDSGSTMTLNTSAVFSSLGLTATGHCTINIKTISDKKAVDRTVVEVRKKVWIPHLRKIVKKMRDRCLTCRRVRGKRMKQRMGDLPKRRLAYGTPPFFHSGVDLFGPLVVVQKRSSVKRYGVLYTCLSTRAIHLEVAEDLSTSAFLNTLERFTARRGKPDTMDSDNGTNFVGAKACLKEVKSLMSHKDVAARFAKLGITWRTNCPAASHQGGAWERLIRCVRELILVTLKGETVNDDRLYTTLCKIENVLNSRPLTKMYDTPESVTPITPNDILTLRPPVPVFPVPLVGERYKRDWRQAHHLLGVFWERWLGEYLPELNRRSKWVQKERNLEVGELVILSQDQYPRYQWPLAVVKEVYKGPDGLVRNVLLKTRSGEYRRPVSKIIRLEGDLPED